jgi:hypothetical protein
MPRPPDIAKARVSEQQMPVHRSENTTKEIVGTYHIVTRDET